MNSSKTSKQSYKVEQNGAKGMMTMEPLTRNYRKYTEASRKKEFNYIYL